MNKAASLDQLKQYFFDALDIVPLPLLISEGIVSDNVEDGNRAHVFFNRAFKHQLGYTLDTMPDIYSWFDKAYPDPLYRQEVISHWHQVVHRAQIQGERTAELPALISHADGTQRWYAVTAQVDVAPNPDWHIVVLRDIHQLKTSLEETTHASLTDSLTQLSNRRGVNAWLKHQEKTHTMGVILLDIDRFKRVNDTLGHVAGDRLLVQIAGQLRQLTTTDTCCARWGGEEFAIFLPNSSPQKTAQLANDICLQVHHEGFLWQAKWHNVSVSAGCALSSSTIRHVDDIIQHADNALYKAKQSGRNQVCYDWP
ncbi:GGDEF domain-containing protein [Salinivibrio sp. ES.052]|uniref:GGDEF domain-containing protein n=1 Tax=Salinivibrio sp. ES.052 TaxID=1882823 RepID=UPI00092CB1DA|nr:GGDEF domain-containing protein [Salinivibrio sp. ES.052]SIN73183.1 diguanylate cyclase (GGDEF) domain-containing protein [Salinivibrio sp. ES.052]